MGGYSNRLPIVGLQGDELDAAWEMDVPQSTATHVEAAPQAPIGRELALAAPKPCIGAPITVEVTSLLGKTPPTASNHQELPVRTPVLNPLTDDELEAFARAEFALGTEVGVAVSEEVWFQELQCLVPRRPARASSAPALRATPEDAALEGIGLPTPVLPDAYLSTEEDGRAPKGAHESKKPGLWARLRNSLR